MSFVNLGVAWKMKARPPMIRQRTRPVEESEETL